MSLKADYPITAVCEVLRCSRSSVYYQSQDGDEADLKGAIERLAGEWVTYGYRRITKMLERDDWVVNHKRVRRIMGEMRLL